MLACWAFCETEKERPMSDVDTTITHIGAPAPMGHNSGAFVNGSPNSQANSSPNDTPNRADAQLRSVVDRIERLEEEKKGIAHDIRDVYAEAKGNGYDIKALRTIIRLRKLSDSDRQEQETILETYMQAMGMI